MLPLAFGATSSWWSCLRVHKPHRQHSIMVVHGGFVPEGVVSMPTEEGTAPAARLFSGTIVRTVIRQADGLYVQISSWYNSGQAPRPEFLGVGSNPGARNWWGWRHGP